jgi:hypothetical protein
MQVIEKNSLFAQVSGEQSAVVSGGTFPNLFNYAVFSLLSVQAASPEGGAFTQGEQALAVIVLYNP